MLSCMTVMAQHGEILYEELNILHVGGRELNFDHDEYKDLHIVWHNYYGQNEYEITNLLYIEDTLGHYGWDRSPWFWKRYLNVGDTISNVSVWEAEWGYCYETAFEEEGYLALRHVLPDGSSCYGWLRYRSYLLENDMTHGWVDFYDYAYCTEPGYPLRVGQTGFDWEVKESQTLLGHFVWPNPVDDILSIRFSPDVTSAIVEIYDLQGRRVLTQTKALDRIPVEGLPSGTYLVCVTMGDGSTFSEKVVKR